ncbi:polyprenyl synthetase family protein [Candidatus Saganbacteria bacterium]|nr:polyprenyl synthetase family protein [Candidatus Saganbacteria bacterium]
MSKDKLIIEKALEKYLPRKGELAKAMRYSVFAGGKRFRPSLCLATARVLGCPLSKVIPLACAVELVHTFTLVHDDLPAMDNSDLRRGKPACHKVFGEALAILAGDGLNTLAFKIIAYQPKAAQELAGALLAVVEGQVRDIKSVNQKMTLAKLRAVHGWKTAALLKACVRGSAMICGAKSPAIKALTNYAQHLGLAFQITDDILDVTSTREKLGKPVESDVKKGFPYFFGLEKSKVLVVAEKNKAVKALDSLGNAAGPLKSLAEYVIGRVN